MIRSYLAVRFLMSLGGLFVAVALASGGAQSATTPGMALDGGQAVVTEAAEIFADAPDGVDPIVTGPVSAAFRHRQADAGCDKAVWPNIPTVCYPN